MTFETEYYDINHSKRWRPQAALQQSKNNYLRHSKLSCSASDPDIDTESEIRRVQIETKIPLACPTFML